MDGDGQMHECRAAGRFRKERMKPVVGDYVSFDAPTSTSTGYIREIKTRHNVLIRPPAANVDLQLILASPKQPAADLSLVDKLILQARFQDIEPVLCVNKADLFGNDAAELARRYSGACRSLSMSAETGQGVDELRSLIEKRTICFSGQSAVGKTTLLNRLCGESQLTGELSAKTERGRHTTRTAELFYSPQADAYIMDTPGFSVFDGIRLEPAEISQYYSDFAPYKDTCRFSSCLHRDEPDCGVKAAVEAGTIDAGRYKRYLDLVREEESKAW